jgi:demethylspheroidene O-methyltransferase
MIRHHDVLYRDMADPVAFFRDSPATELAAFWPYVFGANGHIDPETAKIYSDLMAESQTLVAEEALGVLDLKGIGTLLDIGGGTGAFLTAVGRAYPDLQLHLFDLPQVIAPATARFVQAGLAQRMRITGGSFRTDALPEGADAISLIRVLYDHSDDTVHALLAKVHAALPQGGRVIISEPMSGGDHPERAGDAYFGLYCLAMGTGRARSADEISQHLQASGFTSIITRKTARSFITSVIEARKV